MSHEQTSRLIEVNRLCHKLALSVRDLINRDDFWDSVEWSGIAIPKEFSEVSSIIAELNAIITEEAET